MFVYLYWFFYVKVLTSKLVVP